jgi:hypothetical protein
MRAHYVNTVAAPASKHGTLLVAGGKSPAPEIEPISVNDKTQASFHVQKEERFIRSGNARKCIMKPQL